MTRRRVVWITILLLLLLDAGRSINARKQYASPAEVWQPDPSAFADLAWPPGHDIPQTAPLGARVYARWCAVCHGPDGRGNGPAAPSLIPRPRDFTLGFYKYKSTPAGRPPAEQDLMNTIKNGLPGSAMPYFHDLLSDAEIRAVASQIKTYSKIFDEFSEQQSISIPPAGTADAASIARGQALYQTEGCAGCHGNDLRKRGFLQDAKNDPVLIRDLTSPWNFGGGSSPDQIWLRLTTGLAGSSMPSYEQTMSVDQRWDLVHYIESQARVPPWEPGGKLGGPAQHTDLLQRGEYIVRAEMCGLCHTQINHTGIYRDDYYLAGGMRVGAYPHGLFISRNLTSDPETGLGRWTESQITKAIRNGRTPDRLLNMWGMPWFYLHYFTDSDATAVAKYLKSLPPVRNRIPLPVHFGVIETIASKLTRQLPAALVTVLTYANGNFGRQDSSFWRESLQGILINLQWLILAIGVIAFFFAAKRGERLPRTPRGWLITFGAIIFLILIGVLGWVVYSLPTLRFIPPKAIVSGATAGIPVADPARLKSPEHKVMVERGRYLYTVASCAFCHLPSGAGGRKISWKAFGTLWTRNITSDRETGIGAWKDEEIMRAIRSGITPDGRILHWQGMIWDHASNWDEEDLRAIVAYLRLLPPVSRTSPDARPPAPEDCDVYTFFIVDSFTPGCRPI